MGNKQLFRRGVIPISW